MQIDTDGLSSFQAKAIQKIVQDDNGFHPNVSIADYPFSDISTKSENGLESVSPHCSFDISTDNGDYTVELLQSDENECWFYEITTTSSGDVVRGILHFNAILNARGESAFVFLNDNDGLNYGDITYNIQYCNFLVLEL